MARKYDFEAEEAKLDAQWKEIEHASKQLDKASRDLDKVYRVQRTSSQPASPRRQFTAAEKKQAEEMLGKVAEVGLKSVATVTAVAGAGIVSLFKRDSKPIASTFNWCKKTLWGKK
ncbi:MAG: hypothetical protein IJI36_01275 [Kiritimatiellae bacterium]|nr:hypothetical protein [Kiritimatiellia bacterium]